MHSFNEHTDRLMLTFIHRKRHSRGKCPINTEGTQKRCCGSIQEIGWRKTRYTIIKFTMLFINQCYTGSASNWIHAINIVFAIHANYGTTMEKSKILRSRHPDTAVFAMQQRGRPHYLYLYGDLKKCVQYILNKSEKHFFEVCWKYCTFTNIHEYITSFTYVYY